MKFGKSLSTQLEETLPEWRDKYLSYKELKKRLKHVCAGGADDDDGYIIDPSNKRPRLSDEEAIRPRRTMREEIDFIQLLEAEVEKFNDFFEEKQEEYIIRLEELHERVTKAKELSLDLVNIHKEIVDFHGEMVLLENYSALNYTGLVKIMKKYDKRTGALIRLPFTQRVLQEPFFRMETLYDLIKQCELMLDHLVPVDQPLPPINTEYIESLFMKCIVSALRSLKEIRSGSSTVSAFSLPPLQISVLEEYYI